MPQLSPPSTDFSTKEALRKNWNGFLILSSSIKLLPLTFKQKVMKETTLADTKLKKVLIIEDEGDMCLLLNILLNGKEMDLDHVKTLLAASDYLEKEQPSVIILDNKLPDGFGVDFITYIKKKFPNIKIIMISGFDGSVKDVAIEAGADVFLEKPFTKDQLYNSIKGLLN
jgi:two-component system, OmpR family, response regulator